MTWRNYIYYDPEKYGLEIVSEIDSGGSYEFDMVVLWKRTEDGKLFWGADSGCSCPTPFEDVTEVADLNPLPETAHNLREALKSHQGSSEFAKAAGV